MATTEEAIDEYLERLKDVDIDRDVFNEWLRRIEALRTLDKKK